ncbi:PLP-dependent aminotransferase family protein [Bacillus sp. JJ722]|uniref:MocR-like pyridoxine biosynthesis transcription factor PdxR n=1 Tax=Bacillus sp. JJ722 TaxID=3122973 RepID=UPI003000624A
MIINELLFHIDKNSPIPRYVQVYKKIKKEIMEGKIPPNSKLPSIRNLADALNLSRNTTQLAYEQLLAEGFVRSESKRGYFVERLPIDNYSTSSIKVNFQQTVKSPSKDMIDFRLGAVDEEHFPLDRWRILSNRILKDSSIYTYGDHQGDPLLRESIAKYLYQSRGVNASADQIIVGSNTQQLLFLLCLLLKNQFHSIAFEEPGYQGAKEVFRQLGFDIESIPVNCDGLQLQTLEKANSKLVYVTPSHQFPLGMIMPIHNRLALLNWAEKQDGYIIEDDYDSEFRYKQKPIPAMFSLNNNERVIYIGSFSKALLPSIRIGYLVLPNSLLKNYKKIKLLFEQSASNIHQRTLHYFIEEGAWGVHINKMRSIYKKKMIKIKEVMQQYTPPSIKLSDTTLGMHIILKIHTSKTEDELIELAAQHHIKVYKTSIYYETPNVNTGFVQLMLGFAGLTEFEIEKGLKTLMRIYKD